MPTDNPPTTAEKNFLGLARKTSDLAERAKINKLDPKEIFGSTFTVTNPGIFGGLFGMGIINQPNVGILAVGAFQKRPVVKTTDFGDSILITAGVPFGHAGSTNLLRITEIISD